MDRLFCTANHYYAVLERFGLRNLMTSAWTWLWILFAVAFVWRVVVFAWGNENPDGSLQFLSIEFGSLLFLEVVVLFLSFKLQSEKKRIALERINKRYRQSFASLHQARRFLLQKLLGRGEGEYLKLMDEIQKAIDYHEKLRSPLAFSFARILQFLYDPNSKQNIYALLLMIVSILAALIISEGGGITPVFELFAGESSTAVLLIWVIIAAFFALLLLILFFVRHSVELLSAYISVRIDGKAARNPHTLRYLQRDLLAFHRFIAFRGGA